ncbi:MAG TPA: serine hydrolase domain-containing protein [Gemmatimonadales bacterium]|nr:serine hydrolase domain-containing protein [Gemmatimonadales bacterium]
MARAGLIYSTLGRPTARLIMLPIALACTPAEEPVVTAGLLAAAPEAVGLSSERLERIEGVVQAHLDGGRLAGAVVAVARQGQLAFLESYGVMDLERGDPMRTDAIFRICSMTKPVTAVAAMQLVDRGLLALDDPVSKYIPAFAGVQVYDGGPAAAVRVRPPAGPLTVEDLLRHTGGLTYGLFDTHPVDSLYAQANLFNFEMTLETFADRVATLPLRFDPGTLWNYGVGLDIMGRVIEVASGQSLDDYLQEHLFGPLGMTETGFTFPAGSEARVPTLYMPGEGGALAPMSAPVCGEYGPTQRLLAGGGGLVSTVPDYLRFAQMLLNGGELDGQRILTPASAAALMQNQLPPELVPLPGMEAVLGPLGHPGLGHGYGGGVLVDAEATPIADAPGVYRWMGYASTFFWIDPTEELIGMVWAQYLPFIPPATSIEKEVEAVVYGARTGAR